MARYRLIEKHYLKLDPVAEYEKVELDPTTGKEGRKRFQVPTYLDPEDRSGWNSEDGIILTNKPSKEHPRDYLYRGPPTQGMEPLDAEAEAAIKALERKHPIESLPATGP